MYSDMYPKRDTGVTDLHLRYMSDTSGYMYLGRFLGVTLDTYQDTSGFMYLDPRGSGQLYLMCIRPQPYTCFGIEWLTPS